MTTNPQPPTPDGTCGAQDTLGCVCGWCEKPPCTHLAPTPEEEVREAILKAGTVRSAKITFSQKMYSNDTVSPVEQSNQQIVEIGIDDLMHLFARYAERSCLEVLQAADERLDKDYSDAEQRGKYMTARNRAKWARDNETLAESHARNQGFKSGIVTAKSNLSALRTSLEEKEQKK